MYGTLAVCLFVFVSEISTFQQWNVTTGFRYSKDVRNIYRRADTEECKLCDGEQDCLSLDEARCELYLETSAVLSEDEELENETNKEVVPEIRAEMDSMMYNLVDKASLDQRFRDCIPLISQYTDCTKDNICVGCSTCVCDTEGKWNCTVRQQCEPDSALDVNHRVLIMVLDRLKSDHKISKRSIPGDPYLATVNPEKVAYEELVEWMYGDHPLRNDLHSSSVKPTTQYPSEKLSNLVKRSVTETTTDGRVNFEDIFGWFNGADQLANVESATVLNTDNDSKVKTPTTEINTTATGSTKSEPEILAFEEVLEIIAVDNKNYSGKNSLDMKQNEQVKDYMDLDDSHSFFNIPNVETIAEYTVTEATVVEIFTESVINEVATVVIDLLKTPQTKTGVVNSDDYTSFVDYIDLDNEVDIRYNDSSKVELNAVNIMKREIQVNDTIETATLARMNTTQNIVPDFTQDLNSNVLRPLNNIIHDKKNEIDELMKIKDNLISFMNINNFVFNDNETVTKNKQPSNLSINNLQETPPFLDDLRRSDTNILGNYLTKLKRDVFEVIRDIVNIQKNSYPNKLPEDIKFLIRAMKYYVHKNGFHAPKKANNTLTKNFRRNNLEMVENSDEYSVVDHLILMLESIDKDMPSSNALQPLSLKIRKILKRIIKQHYTDEFSIVGLKVYDPHYNLTNDINNIGTKWEKASTNIINSPLSERIYHIKLLHMILSIDVHKMNDALALIDFARTRRMVPVDENIGEEIMSKINLDLRAIDKKVMSFIKKRSMNEKIKATRRETKNHRKKESFLNQIRKLLRNSKTDIRKFLHKKVPKTAIVKELARKKLDRLAKRRLSEYEQTMRKWQSNLKIPTDRQKRSAVFGNRMKNIIPMYLRGKVNYTVHNKRRRKVHSTTAMPKISTTKKKKKFH